MNIDYTKLTHESILTSWNDILSNSEEFKNLVNAGVYQYLQELIAGTTDLLNYYIQRVAEESYLDTAQLTSSMIKLCHNLNYAPKRPVPPKAKLKIKLKGPLPSNLSAGSTVWFSREGLVLNYSSYKFMLDHRYSYTFTASDIADGRGNPSWSKIIEYAIDGNSSELALTNGSVNISKANLANIYAYQLEVKTVVFEPNARSDVGSGFQKFEIDDETFSNFYGERDPMAMIDGTYTPLYGVCKVGIGKDEDEAFIEDNLCYITLDTPESSSEERSVAIRSKPDQTVVLVFGDGINYLPGLKSYDEKLYVQYASTNGIAANFLDSDESEMSFTSHLYALGTNEVVDVTSNVSFVIDGAIREGEDFESIDSMRINAQISDTGSLITKSQFRRWFNALSSPISVEYSIAFGEQQVEDETEVFVQERSNIILYSLLSSIYSPSNNTESSSTSYSVVNLFDASTSFTTTTLYSSRADYINHLLDYVWYLYNPHQALNAQKSSTSVDLFMRNVKSIRSAASSKMIVGADLYAIAPIVQYFDLVGNVIMLPAADPSSIKTSLESSIYSWLISNTNFNTPIYRSDLLKIILDEPGVVRADIDFKVSDWIEGGYIDFYYYAGSITIDDELYLHIPKTDYLGSDLASALEEYTQTYVWIVIGDENSTTYVGSITSVDTTYSDEYVYLYLSINSDIDSDLLAEYNTTIRLSEESYTSEGSWSKASNLTSVYESWISAKSTRTNSLSGVRPVDLPFTMKIGPTSGSSILRSESMSVLGRTGTGVLDENVSEASFMYAIATALQNSEISSDELEEEFAYVYPMLKPAFVDACLNDNHDIVYFSSPAELPIVKVELNYQFSTT